MVCLSTAAEKSRPVTSELGSRWKGLLELCSAGRGEGLELRLGRSIRALC